MNQSYIKFKGRIENQNVYNKLEQQNYFIKNTKEDCMTLFYAFGDKIDMLLDKCYG